MRDHIVEGIIAISIIIILGCSLIGLIHDAKKKYNQESPEIETVQIEYSAFDLVVDGKTGIVYIDNTFKTSYNSVIHDNHIYTPYYSENGKLCKFDDNQLIEIDN